MENYFKENEDVIKNAIENILFKLNRSSLTEVLQFNLNEDNLLHENEELDHQGIYLLEIYKNPDLNKSKWLDEFRIKWDLCGFKWTSTTKRKRIDYHKENDLDLEWIPVYIGKSKCIKKRFKDHINLSTTRTTFALKLKERNQFNNDLFRLSVLKTNFTYYNTIVTNIERHLRDQINPIVGKQ